MDAGRTYLVHGGIDHEQIGGGPTILQAGIQPSAGHENHSPARTVTERHCPEVMLLDSNIGIVLLGVSITVHGQGHFSRLLG